MWAHVFSQTFGHFPQWTQNLSEVAIEFFSTPSISKDIFIFFIFNNLWNWLILSKFNIKMALIPLYFFLQRITRDMKNKNNTSIRGRVSQNSSPKANEITNFEKFLKSMAQTKYIDGRQNIQTSSENIPDTFGNSSTLDLLRKFHTVHFSRHKLHQVLLYKVWCHMGPFPIHIYIFSHYLPHWHG